jgi:probable blue pigment (indigoidine) exporter
VAAAGLGVLGMALMLLAPTSRWDLWGVMAATLSAASMAGGTFLARRWSIGLAPLPLTGWQLLLGGLMLLPASLLLEGPWQLPRLSQGLATAYLSLAGALLAYVLWFRGSLRLPAVGVASLGLLSPLTAAVLGWAVLGQNLGPLGWLGFGLALGSVVLLQRLNAPAPVKDGQ